VVFYLIRVSPAVWVHSPPDHRGRSPAGVAVYSSRYSNTGVRDHTPPVTPYRLSRVKSAPRCDWRSFASRLSMVATVPLVSPRSLHVELLDITCCCLSEVKKGSTGLSTSVSTILFICSVVDVLGQP
jgi:hypothetical protein